MPGSDQLGFDRAPPDFMNQADFDASSMQLVQRVVDLVGDSMVSLTEKTSKATEAFQIMGRMSQSAADNGLDLAKVLERQRSLVFGVADAVSKSNLSYDQQSKIEKQLTGVVKAYAVQMDRVIKQEKLKLRAMSEGTTQYNKQKTAIENATRAAEAQNKALMEAVKIRQRAAQRGGASKRIGSFSSNLGNLTDAAASDTSGLSGWFNSKKETSKKDVLHQSGAWKGSGWGTLDTGKLESNWKSLGVTIGVATVAAGKALGDLARQFENAAVGLAQYKNNVEQAARSMGMIDAKPLEALRSSLDMTRNQAAQLFSVMDQGMSATGKTAAELSNVAQTLKDTFGGDITEQLRTYIDLMKEIPTLQEDLTNGSSEDQTAALYGLASKGKAGELNALMPSGLFGGEQQRQPGADKLDAAQSASSKTEQLGDFLMGLMPTWSSYFAEIPNLVSTFGDVAKVIPTVAGAIEATVLLNNSRRMAQAAAGNSETQANLETINESLQTGSEASNTSLRELQSQNAQSQSSIESAIINSSGGRQIEAQVRKAIPQGAPKIPKLKNPLSARQRIDLSALGNVKSASGASGMFGKLGSLMGKSGLARMGMMAAGVMAWQLSQKGAGIAHDRAKRDLARGDLRNAKNNVYASRAVSTLGGAAAGAAIGKQFGPWGVAIGAAVGALGGFIKSVVDTKDTLNKIRAEEQKNIKEFGTAIIPLTQGKADFDKAMKFSGGLVRASAEKQAQAARALQNALGELSAGVNNAKIQFYALQKELSNLRITRFKRYGAPDAQSAMNAMRMSISAARNTYDTKMGAVNRARDRAKNDKGMTTEARQALLTQAAKEEEVALNELLEATLAASEALSAMPEYIAAGISGDAITDILTKGLVDNADLDTVVKNGMDAWASSLDEINKVAASKTEGLQKAQELANKNGVANVKSFLNNLGGASRQHVLSDKEREELEAKRANLVAANARIKKYGGYKDLSAEEQAAWDKMRGEDKVSSFWAGIQRNLFGVFDSRDMQSGELGQNQAVIEEIDEALKGVGNAIASNAMVDLNQRYGEEMRGVLSPSGEVDQVKAASLVAKLQAEAAEKRSAMESKFGATNTQDIINLRSLEQHKTKRDALEAKRNELTLGGKTDEAAKVKEQIEQMDATFASTLQPTLDRLFANTNMTEEQKKSASAYIQENGFDRFMSTLNAGKDADKLFGGQGTSKEIVDAIRKQANAFAEANKMATELGVLDDAIQNFSSLTVDNFAEILKVEQQRSTAVAEKNEQMINWLKAISQGVDKNTAELRTAAKLANARASLAGVGGDGTKEAGEALAAQIKVYGASTEAAAKALEEMPLVIANLEQQVKDAEGKKEAAQNLVESLEKQYNEQFGGKTNLTEAEKTAAKDMKDKIDKAKATLNVQISDIAKLNKNIEIAKTTQAESHETLATNARANINFMQVVADQIQKGMESTKGLMAKALSEAATTGFEAARFADNVAEGAAAARDTAIDSANRQAEIETKAAEEAFNNLPEMAKEAGNAAAAAIRSGAYNEALSKALGEGKTREEAEKLAEAAKAAADSAAKAAAAAAESDVMEQGVLEHRRKGVEIELNKRNKILDGIKKEADLRRKTVELQQQAVDEMRDFAENYGGSFSEVLQLQNISVQLERQKLDIAKDELAKAEAAGASGQVLLEARQKVLMQEIALRKKEIGVAKSMMDRMLGAAFGQIRQSFGARVQMGTAQHLMGTENTRIKTASGAYIAGDTRTIESRQFERQVNSAFGSASASAAELSANVMQDSSKIFKDSTDIFAGAVSQLNEMINGMFNPSTDRNAETGLWLKAFINSLPRHASGTSSTKKGPMVVGENGPEIVISSGGDIVIPHSAIGSLPHYASGTRRSKKGPVVVGENGTEIVVPSEASINDQIALATKIANEQGGQQEIEWARAREAEAAALAKNDPYNAREAYLEQAQREVDAEREKYTRWNEENYKRGLANKAKNEAARAAGKESNLPEDSPYLESARAAARQREINEHGLDLMRHDRQMEREELERRHDYALNYLYPAGDTGGLRGSAAEMEQKRQAAIKNHPNRPLTDAERATIAQNIQSEADAKTMATLAQVSAGRTDKRSMGAFTTGDGKVWTMDEWRKAQDQKQTQANPSGNSQLSPQQIKQNRELVRMLALGHAAKEMRNQSGGHITTVAERNARWGSHGSMGASKQNLGGQVQNGFVGYNGNISSFQGYSTPINQFGGAKGVSPALDLVRGEDGLLYNRDGTRADARNMFYGGRPGKRIEPLGGLKRDSNGRLSGVSNAKSGMNHSVKAHQNAWTGLSSGNANSPGVAAQGAKGGGGGNLSGKVSGSVELNINPEVFKQTVAPIVMDVVLENAGKISNILMG